MRSTKKNRMTTTVQAAAAPSAALAETLAKQAEAIPAVMAGIPEKPAVVPVKTAKTPAAPAAVTAATAKTPASPAVVPAVVILAIPAVERKNPVETRKKQAAARKNPAAKIPAKKTFENRKGAACYAYENQ